MTSVKKLAGANLKIGDTSPALRLQLLRDDDQPKHLSGSNVFIRLKHSNDNSLTLSDVDVSIVNESNGIVEYEWSDTDIDTVGTYDGEIMVENQETNVTETFPNRGTFVVRVQNRLGDT